MSSRGSEPLVEIRKLRTDASDGGVGFVAFHNRDGHSLGISDEEWKALGCPAYVVVSVRPETFSESTQ